MVRPKFRRLFIGAKWTPLKLFASGETGAWYDPNDLSSLFQSSGGTTAVTASGDPIGRMSDKSGNNNHATQATSTSRPLLNSAAATIGFQAFSSYRLKYDFIDDALLWPGATGTYWIAVANITGIQFYQTTLTQTTGKIPISDCFGMVILNRAFSAGEQYLLTAYFSKYMPLYGKYNYLFECNSTSYIGRGGSCTGTLSWTFGKGTVYATMFTTTETTTAREFLSFLFSNTSLTSFDCNANQLTGSIPSLAANTALTVFHCGSNQLTGSIPSLAANTALQYFYCYANQLTGSIPSLSANIALIYFQLGSNQLTGSIPSLAANTALTVFHCYINQLTGSIPSLSANTALTIFYCHSNQLTGWTGGTVSATLGDFQAQNNLLTQSAVDAILAAFVAANKTTGTRVLNLGGTGNATPSAAGLANKATLVSRGWTVTTN